MLLLNQIAFPIPQQTKDFWIQRDPDANTDLFDPELPLLILPFYPDDLALTYDKEEAGFRDGFSSVTYVKSAERFGFELTLKESAIAAYYCLKQLQKQSEAGEDFIPVICYDYALPEVEDLDQGYTARVGSLQVEMVTGTLRDEIPYSSTRRMFGTRVIFKEMERR